MFKCQKIEGIELPLLVQDFNVTCYQGEHDLYMFLAIAFMILYIVGIPLMMFMLLWRHRSHLHDEESPKHRWVKTALGGMYAQYEPAYWWFELMILFNKTMMCGGLVILSPGSPIQVLCAILIMLVHLMFVLKLAPYVKDSEDWSSFLTTLGLCLMSLGAYSMKLTLEKQEMKTIEVITTILPCLCVFLVVIIMILFDCGLKKCLCGSKANAAEKTGGNGQTSLTQVQPIQAGDANSLQDVRLWGDEEVTKSSSTKSVNEK